MKKKKSTSMRLVLDGEVRVEETRGNQTISSEQIDGGVVLGLIIQALQDYMDRHPITIKEKKRK